VIERGGRREERVRRLCLRLWRRRGRPGVSHFLSEQEILALAENAIRSSGGELQGDEIAKLLAWVESVRVAAVLIDMAVAQEVAVRPGVNGEGEFGMRPDTAAPGHGPVPHPLAVDPAALAALRELLAENPARSNARLAAIVLERTGLKVSEPTVNNYRHRWGFPVSGLGWQHGKRREPRR